MSQNVVICFMALVTVWLKNQIGVAMGEFVDLERTEESMGLNKNDLSLRVKNWVSYE